MYLAAQAGHVEVVEVLLGAGADTQTKSGNQTNAGYLFRWQMLEATLQSSRS
jgi:hypothetical protein